LSNTIQKNRDYKKYVVDSKLQYFKPHATKIENTFAEEIFASLNADLNLYRQNSFMIKKDLIFLKKYACYLNITLQEQK